MLFLSGTEGLPKGVMLTHNNILASERAYCAPAGSDLAGCFMMPAPLWSRNGLSASA
ncbi:AMP-binding protein [Escherichia coli]